MPYPCGPKKGRADTTPWYGRGLRRTREGTAVFPPGSGRLAQRGNSPAHAPAFSGAGRRRASTAPSPRPMKAGAVASELPLADGRRARQHPGARLRRPSHGGRARLGRLKPRSSGQRNRVAHQLGVVMKRDPVKVARNISGDLDLAGTLDLHLLVFL